jgi:hypothetical protein
MVGAEGMGGDRWVEAALAMFAESERQEAGPSIARVEGLKKLPGERSEVHRLHRCYHSPREGL